VNTPLPKILFAFAALLFALPVPAGTLSFRLSLTGSELTVDNQGDSSAFYPAIFRMLADGRWAQLEASAPPAELAPGMRLQLKWPDAPAAQQAAALERMQPVMVRFFDQAGVGFGQVSMLRPPPAAAAALKARYASGLLQIDPPEGVAVRATWVLWPQENGIGPISRPVRFEHKQPPARRIDWARQGKAPFQFDAGAGQPNVMLVHETGDGYALQAVPGGGLGGREQRTAWLDATPKFYAAALIALVLAVGAMALQFLRRPRRGAAA